MLGGGIDKGCYKVMSATGKIGDSQPNTPQSAEYQSVRVSL